MVALRQTLKEQQTREGPGFGEGPQILVSPRAQDEPKSNKLPYRRSPSWSSSGPFPALPQVPGFSSARLLQVVSGAYRCIIRPGFAQEMGDSKWRMAPQRVPKIAK